MTDEAPAGLPQNQVRNCESQKGKRTIWLLNSTVHCQPAHLRTMEEHSRQPWWTRHPPEQRPSTSTRPTKRSRLMTKAGGRGPAERSRPRPTTHARQTPKRRRHDHDALQDVQCVGCNPRVQQVQGRHGPQEKITKKRRARRYRMSAADAERPRRVAERARTCAKTNHLPSPEARRPKSVLRGSHRGSYVQPGSLSIRCFSKINLPCLYFCASSYASSCKHK